MNDEQRAHSSGAHPRGLLVVGRILIAMSAFMLGAGLYRVALGDGGVLLSVAGGALLIAGLGAARMANRAPAAARA